MQTRPTSLAGNWTGVYDYDDADTGGGPEAVPFTASLFDVAGAVWGTTREPNTFAPGFGEALDAEVNGTRTGTEVRFRKVYVGPPPNGEFPVEYAGHVVADGARVEGFWQIRHPTRPIGGPFVMNRTPGQKSAAARTVAAEVPLGR